MTHDDDAVMTLLADRDPAAGTAGWAAGTGGAAVRHRMAARVEHRRRQRRAVALAGAVAAVASVGTLALAAADDEAPQLVDAADPPPAVSVERIDAGPLAGGGEGWRVVAMGSDLFASGPDGAFVLDTGTATWSPVSPPPAPVPATDGVAAWTGEELLLWGTDGTADVGLAYAPSSDRWRTMAPAPIAARDAAVAGFDGTELLVWGGSRFDGPAEPPASAPGRRELDDAAAYDPATDRWRLLRSRAPGTAVGPLRTGVGAEPVAVVTDGGGQVAVVRYSARDDAWRPAEPSGVSGSSVSAVAVDGGITILVSTPATGDDGPAVVAAARWAPGGWATLPAPPVADAPEICPQVAVGLDDRPVVARCGAAATLDDGRWLELDAVDLEGWVVPLEGAVAVIDDDVVVIYR